MFAGLVANLSWIMMRVMTVANMSMMMPIGSVVRMVRIFGVVALIDA